MKRQATSKLLCTVGLILISACSSLYVEKSPARVLITEDRSVEDGYMVRIDANGETRQLRLVPMESIWSDDALSLSVSHDQNGKEVFEYKRIPKDIKIYHDSSSKSVLSVNEGKLNGIIDSDYMIKSENGQHFVMKATKEALAKFDYKRIPETARNMVYKRISKEQSNYTTKKPVPEMINDYFRQAPKIYTAEVAVIVDSKLATLIGNNTKIYEYMSIFWNAVNMRYKTIEDPIIKIRLVGTYIIRSSASEPFITNNLSGEKAYGDYVLEDESYWVYTKLNTLPAHDLIYLQTGRDLIDLDGSSGLGGIAYMGAACAKNGGDRSWAVGLGEDIGAFYDGVHIATHEVAHILGSPHDAEEGTEDCPWNDGYIMSYEGGSINHMFFSTCSSRTMAAYLALAEAACVLSNLAQTTPPGVYTSTSLPGDKISMREQCRRITGNNLAEVNTEGISEDSLCYNLQCTYSDEFYIYTTQTYQSACEGAACPSFGHCHDGACV